MAQAALATGLFSEVFGTKGDTLIMVHGLGGTSNTWYPQSQILAREFRITTYDLAGSGRSAVRPSLTLAGHVDDLLDVVNGVAVDGAVHLVGHSLGTIICQHFAARYPDRVASLALVGAFPEPPAAARTALRDRAIKARQEGLRAIADATVAAGTSADTKLNGPAIAAFVRESVMGQPPEGYAQNCEVVADATRADLTRISCPTLLVTGDEDRTAPPDVGRAMASGIKGAEFKIIAGCGHWAPVERAKQLNYALTVFYARQRQRPAG